MNLDHWVARLLAPLVFWVLLNGVDDLVIDVAALWSAVRRCFSADPRERTPTEADLDAVPARRMAIFVALWKEHRVIRKMIDNNVTRLRYPHADFFVGAYPNDAPTLAAIREVTQLYPNVHLSVSPHDGPTSKADNLNWIYQRMLLYEEEHGVRFDMILTHDAEDIMDPDGLRWINYYAEWYDMVQIPVLALPTPFREIAHGVYCDDFAESQFKEMPARELLGGFIPSSGVGTAFSRRAVEQLAAKHQNRIFEPVCLTEDYENGWRVHRLGLKQKFIPIRFREGRAVATREYFPRDFRAAVKQRTRWVTGIVLQSWELHTARETLDQLYWFWRDRKGLAGNLVSAATNVLFVAGGATWTWARAMHHSWPLALELARLYPLYIAGLCLQALHTSIRTLCSAAVYGWRFACGVPLRVIAGNWINLFATMGAIVTYTRERLAGRPLRWVKTEHAYPNRAALLHERQGLGAILTGSHWITPSQLDQARETKPPGSRLGEHLVATGVITERDLYAALSLQNNLPLGMPAEENISIAVTRMLPLAVASKWGVLPFRIAAGELFVTASELPGDEMQRDLRRFSSLEIRFHLVTPTEFRELAERYLNPTMGLRAGKDLLPDGENFLPDGY